MGAINFDMQLESRVAEPEVKLVPRERGGRNIWREGDPLAVDDLVDAMDKEKSWFESFIVEIRGDGAVKVHFMGWGSKWDGRLD